MATLRRLSLAAVPALILILSFLLMKWEGPYSLSSNLDPDYNYLLNGLNVLERHSPGHIDHPGTTLQEISAAVIVTKYIADGGSLRKPEAESAVLADPEPWLRAINHVLGVLLAASVLWAGWTMEQVSGSLGAALVLQLSFFMFTETVIALPRVAPEPLYMAVEYALMATLIPALVGRNPAGGRWTPGSMSAGALWGFGLVTKLLFLPLAALAFLFPGRDRRLRFAAGAAGALMIFSVPIWGKLPKILDWCVALLTHSERYGNGPTGLPPVAEMIANCTDLFQREPFLFGFIGLYVAVLAGLYFGIRDRADRFLPMAKRLYWIGLGCMVVQIAAAIKHYYTRYTIPAMILTALLNACLILLLSSQALKTAWRALLGGLAAILFLGALIRTPGMVQAWVARKEVDQAAAQQLAEKRREAGDCVEIGFYSASLPSYSLEFASHYSTSIHGIALERIYSDQMTFNRWGGGFVGFGFESRLDKVKGLLSEGRCVLLQGGAQSGGQPLDLPGFRLELVATAGPESLYRLHFAAAPAEPPAGAPPQ